MKKILKLTALVLAMIFVLTACGGNKPADTSAGTSGDSAVTESSGSTEVKVVKISNNQAATHPVNVALEQFKAKVEERTNGSLRIDLYPAGTLADDVAAIDQVQLGSIDGAVVMSTLYYLWAGTDNALGYIEELPFLFPDAESARKAYDGALGEAYAAATEEFGIHTINYWENGFRNMTNNIRPIYTPEDMQGIKFRIANSEIRQQTFDTLKATAIPMNFNELFTGLQQGTVDGQENPLSIIQTSKFYEVQKYLSLSRHIYNTATFIVNPAFYATLTAEEQQIFEEEADNARDYMRQLNDEFEKNAIQELEAAGMEINEIDSQAFIDAVQPVWDSFRETYGSELIDIALSGK